MMNGIIYSIPSKIPKLTKLGAIWLGDLSELALIFGKVYHAK